MTSKPSKAKANSSLAKDDSAQIAQPEEGVLFPIAPETPDIPSNRVAEKEAPPSAEKSEPEELLRPSHVEAKTLCNLAAQIKALAPWHWMEETDVFGVEDPDTSEIGFVSVMGHIGEYEAVGVYVGAEALFGLIDLHTAPSASPDRLMQIPQVQLAFSESKFLEKRDRDLLKGSGLKFTGAKPMFRSYRPGHLPWFITLMEARLLIHALSQTLEMSKRFAEEPAIFPNEGDGETESFLVRVSRQEDTSRRENMKHGGPSSPTGLLWEDQIKCIARPTVPRIEISIDGSLLRDLKSLPFSALQLEADLFIGPGGIGEPHERPVAIYMLMLADRDSGMILGFEALTAEDSLNTMHAGVPEAVARLLWKGKMLPKQIIVRSDLLLDLLEGLAKELKIQLRRANELPAIDEAAASMAQFLATGKM